ncbi:MAG TPA: tetratricopeptide repeat protein [Ramlibacter sp.]|nr:tetratricopeptide repeat protein [Ramlibacter sp.]
MHSSYPAFSTTTGGLSPGFRWIGVAEPAPEVVDQVARQAAMHASRGEYSQALASYGRALLLDDSRAVLWFNYANLQRTMGFLRDAAESFEFALGLDPRLFAARYSLANLLIELGQPLAAREHFWQVTRDHPEYMPAWRNLGRLQCAIGDLEAARESLARAQLLAPHDPEIAGLLLELDREQGSPPEN